MNNLICLNKISPKGLNVLPSNFKVSEGAFDDAIGVLVRSASMHETKLPNTILCVARAGAGVNNIPIDDYAKDGVVVFNTPGANANAVKELTIAGMLLAARDIKGSMKWVDDNKNDEFINKNMEKAKSAYAGGEIFGKTLGVIGCGAIGSLVAEAAGHLGMHVIGVELDDKTINKFKDRYPRDMEFVGLDELYERSDYISLHIPLLESTRGIINKESFEKMKDGVVIVNCARDALVNDDDLKEAIDNRKVHRYVTDFPNVKTANMINVISFSHLGASTLEAEDNCAIMACNQIVDFVENGNIINSVNYPSIDLGKRNGKRILVLHESSLDGTEIIDIVSQTKKVLKTITASKGKYGATLMEVECQEEHCAIKQALSSLKGIIRIRGIK